MDGQAGRLPNHPLLDTGHIGALICPHLADGAPVGQVVVDSVDRSIEVLCGGIHSDGSCKPQFVCLDHVIDRHPEVADLIYFGVPPYHAYRDPGEDWSVEFEGGVYLFDEIRPRLARLARCF